MAEPKTVDIILVRIAPTQPRAAADFTNDLQGLEISAYDLTIDKNNPVNGGVLLGTASGIVPTLGTLDFGTQPTPLTIIDNPVTGVPKFKNGIMQHFLLDQLNTDINAIWLFYPKPATYAALATAVIVVDIAPGDQPHREYPSSSGYDIRLQVTRNGAKIPTSTIEYNVNSYTINTPIPTLQAYYMGYAMSDLTIFPRAWLGIGLDQDISGWPRDATSYLSIPPAPPNNAIDLVAIDIVNGQAPPFDDLLKAINDVLALEWPLEDEKRAHNLQGLENPLTQLQCQYVASQLIWNRVRYPPPSIPAPLEKIYTVGADVQNSVDQGPQDQRKWEGSLSAYHATHDAEVLILAKFIFAASAAVYAEKQTVLAKNAILTFPVIEDHVATTQYNHVSIMLTDVAAQFVVPAAYFYALSCNQAIQITEPARYSSALNTSEDRLVTAFQAALDAAILGTTEAPITVSGSGLDLDQAARRIAALGSPPSQGNMQTISSTAIPTLVSGWLAQSTPSTTIDTDFWTPIITGSDYLTLILQVVTQGYEKLITAIRNTFAHQHGPNLVADDVLESDPSVWSNMFNADNSLLPPWTSPGTIAHRIDVFLQYLASLISVNSAPAPSGLQTDPNQIPTFPNAIDAVNQFLRKVPTDFTFTAQTLNINEVDTVLSSLFSSVELQKKVKGYIETIHVLCQLTMPLNPPTDNSISPLQFSQMEALYARGFTTYERVLLLTQSQFTAALRGTIAYSAASIIYGNAKKPPSPTIPPDPEPQPGFGPVNPGTLIDCIPPAYLSPLGRVQYLHDLLHLEFGTSDILKLVSARREGLDGFLASKENLEIPIPRIDLVNESLEYMVNSEENHGLAKYNTEGGRTAGKGITESDLLAAIPAYSSPANGPESAGAYKKLASDMSTPELPYAQALDINRTYLNSLQTSRYETMLHFRTDISEFVLDPTHEPSDFQRSVWRQPVRSDIAVEYLQICNQELQLYTITFTPEQIQALYGFTADSKDWTSQICAVPLFLKKTELNYDEFLALWKCGFVKFSPGEGQQYPKDSSASIESLLIVFSENQTIPSLYKLAVFIRLWSQLKRRFGDKAPSFQQLAEICNCLQLFKGDNLNPDFVRQLVSLFTLRDLFGLPINLNLWAADAPEAARKEAIRQFVLKIEQYSKLKYHSPKPKHKNEVLGSLQAIARLAGFTETRDWNSNPTCTIRFSEILSKLFASTCSVTDVLYLFTANTKTSASSPFPFAPAQHTLDDPLNIPDNSKYNLWTLREKLLAIKVTEENIKHWSWEHIDRTLRQKFGLTFTGPSDPFIVLGEHFFPGILADRGYHVPKVKQHFSVPLKLEDTDPGIWQGPPYGPFHYHPSSQELVVRLPLQDDSILEQLGKLRQFNDAEQKAVIALYLAPKAALTPFRVVLGTQAIADKMIQESEEPARFRIFQEAFALFYLRCEIIAKHLAAHVKLNGPQTHLKESDEERERTAWEILKRLFADENSGVQWEPDSGKVPADCDFKWDPHFSGGAFSALLGLCGTGLLGKYSVGDEIRWYEIGVPTNRIASSRRDEDIPLPTIIPSLAVKPSPQEAATLHFKNGFAIINRTCQQVGGAEAYSVCWTGVLLFENSGLYEFSAEEWHGECTVTLERGGREWIVIHHDRESRADHENHSPYLHRGTYNITIQCHSEPCLGEDIQRGNTEYLISYSGPDTDNESKPLPLDKLYILSKDGPLELSPVTAAGSYVQSQYYSTLRDVRRTYERAFKALFLTQAFQLSTKLSQCWQGQHELGYLLGQGEQFEGTSYYESAPSVWQSHHAHLDFNFLPVGDPFILPEQDTRSHPAPQRSSAMLDWWERLFDYCCLRAVVQRHEPSHDQPPLWILFQDAGKGTAISDLLRRLDVKSEFESLVSNYYQGFVLASKDLVNEKWALRVWHARQWLQKLQRHFFSTHLDLARPDLWTADELAVNDDNSLEHGNQNLTRFFVTSCLEGNGQPHIKEIRIINDGIRERSRNALVSYLCTMQRVQIGKSWVTSPQQLSAQILQDVQVGLHEKATRIEDVISSIQMFVQRAILGLESSADDPGFQMTREMSELWERQYSTFESWEHHQRRVVYSENWVQWEELQVARQSEAFEFFERQLGVNSLAIPVTTPALPWNADNSLPKLPLKTTQVFESSTLEQQSSGNAQPDGLNLLGEPEFHAQPTLVTSTDTGGLELDGLEIPLWLAAAVRMGTAFIRVAAAGLPPAITRTDKQPKSNKSESTIDEYYFWLIEGKGYDPTDTQTNADIGMVPNDPSSSSWDPPESAGPSILAGLLAWPARPVYHLLWTRIHLGEFQPLRRSEAGVILQVGDTATLTLSGRTFDSLSFTVLGGADGFRYDLVTDSAVPTPSTDKAPDQTITQLPASPFFVYFDQGAPLFPTTPFCTALAIAGVLQTKCRFKEALDWCRAAFDPLQNNNSWIQPPDPKSEEGSSSVVVGPAIARARLVLIQYVEILLQWATTVLEQQSEGATNRTFALLEEVGRLLGPKPATGLLDTKLDIRTVYEFQASSPSLNSRLMSLYDRREALRSALKYIEADPAAFTQTFWQSKILGNVDGDCLSGRQPYRFPNILGHALELATVTKTLGSELLAAYEKGDAFYLDALRTAHEHHILDLGQVLRQNEWREADWQVQALQQTMASALTRLTYYNGLLSAGMISDEQNYESYIQSSSDFHLAASILDATGSVFNAIPDVAFGWAGIGPYDSTSIPVGQKIGFLFAAAARVVGNQGDAAATQASFSLTKAEWERRTAEWTQQVNQVNIEIAEIKRQGLAAERRRDNALQELNNYQIMIEHSAEVQDFLRDKLTTHDLYLFLQQETATMYRKAYDMAYQAARKTQNAFCFERGTTIDVLPEPGWNNIREGLLAGERLDVSLRTLETKFMDLNIREYEITKHVSLRIDLPYAFLQLRTTGYCEIDLPEWMFDKDYPGQFMRRIRNVSLSLPAVVGPYINIHCRLQLLSSSVRADPSFSKVSSKDVSSDGTLITRFAATEAVATSSGQDDTGLFELNFRDDRYLPFEFSGAVSRWRVEMPEENNQFDYTTLADMVMHLNYTAREGGPESRKLANERCRNKLPGDGIRYFDVRHELPDSFAAVLYSERTGAKGKGCIDIPLRFRRSMFPFLPKRQGILLLRIEIFIQPLETLNVGQHLTLDFVPPTKDSKAPSQKLDCVVSSALPTLFHGSFEAEPCLIKVDKPYDFGTIKLPRSHMEIDQIYYLCHYAAEGTKPSVQEVVSKEKSPEPPFTGGLA